MDVLFADAERLLSTAVSADDHSFTDTAILLQRDGSIRVTGASGWALPAFLSDSGAAAVYRITRNGGAVRVEGRSRVSSCLLERRTAPLGPRQVPSWRALLSAPAPGKCGTEQR
jgi:hypothetical protein